MEMLSSLRQCEMCGQEHKPKNLGSYLHSEDLKSLQHELWEYALNDDTNVINDMSSEEDDIFTVVDMKDRAPNSHVLGCHDAIADDPIYGRSCKLE